MIRLGKKSPKHWLCSLKSITITTRHDFQSYAKTLAALAATAKETVIRTISDFKEEGLITVEENDIVIRSVKHWRIFAISAIIA